MKKEKSLLKIWTLFLFIVVGFIAISPARVRVELIFILLLLAITAVIISKKRIGLVKPIIAFTALYLTSLFLPESYLGFILSLSGMVFAGMFALILADWLQSSG